MIERNIEVKSKAKHELKRNGETRINKDGKAITAILIFDDCEITYNDGMYEQTFTITSISELYDMIDDLFDGVI